MNRPHLQQMFCTVLCSLNSSQAAVPSHAMNISIEACTAHAYTIYLASYSPSNCLQRLLSPRPSAGHQVGVAPLALHREQTWHTSLVATLWLPLPQQKRLPWWALSVARAVLWVEPATCQAAIIEGRPTR